MAGAYGVINGWLVQEAGGCTCAGTMPHQPGCGWEPLVQVADFLPALRDSGLIVEERKVLVAAIAAAIRTDMILRHAEMFQKAGETADLAIRTVEKNRDAELPE